MEAVVGLRQKAVRVFRGDCGENGIDARAAHERRAAHDAPVDQVWQADAGRDAAAGGRIADLVERGAGFLQNERMAQQRARRCSGQAKLGQGKIIDFLLFRMENGANDRIRVAHGVAQHDGGGCGGKPHGRGEANGAKNVRHGRNLRNCMFFCLNKMACAAWAAGEVIPVNRLFRPTIQQ